MTNRTFQLETVSCPSCIAKIEGMLKKTGGISSSEVLFNSSRVKVSFDESALTAEEIRAKRESLGYVLLSDK